MTRSIVGTAQPEDEPFLEAAREEARQGWDEGGIPIGSVIVHDGAIIGRGHNRRIQNGSPTLHGEMDAFERAGRQPASVYRNSTIYTTLSPCSMCTGAILLYGIPRVVIGENASFMGEEDLLRSRGVEVVVFDDAECRALMERMIEERADEWFEDIGTEVVDDAVTEAGDDAVTEAGDDAVTEAGDDSD